MICERCQYQQRDRRMQTANGNWMQRCERCGTPHSCAVGREASAISPPLLSIGADGVLSPWFDGRYRPCTAGVYECEFRDGLRLRLAWGSSWTWTGLAVDTSELLKWRGKW
jgi:hypothetical protein